MESAGNIERPLLRGAHVQIPGIRNAYHCATIVCDLRRSIFYLQLHVHILCLEAQFEGFKKVRRCDPNGNGWCCASSRGQGLGGLDCRTTSLTTSLEPSPLETGPLRRISFLFGANLRPGPFSSSAASPFPSSFASSFTFTSSLVSIGWSSISIQEPTSPSAAPTNGSDPGNASNSGLSSSDLIAIRIGVSVGTATITGTIFTVNNFHSKEKLRNDACDKTRPGS
jgi:hypothetical protein